MLHDFFRVTEINNIDLGGKGGHLLFRSTFFRFVTRVLARIVAMQSDTAKYHYFCGMGSNILVLFVFVFQFVLSGLVRISSYRKLI